MPIYDFLCPRCASRVEVMQSYNDPAPKCKDCGSPMDRAIARSTGFVLKGDGWSRDNYGIKPTKPKANED